jgi:TonB family protein
MNATYLLQQHDRPIALKLVRRAYQITSGQDLKVTDYYGTQLGLLWLGSGNNGSIFAKDVEPEIDACRDGRVLGSAGRTIAQYSNPGGRAAEYAGWLLHEAIALTQNDPIISTWERDLQRIQSGMPFGHLEVPGRVQLEKRTSGNVFEMQSSSGAEGNVLVNAEIAVDGTVANTIAISGEKELQSAAASAVKQWRFEPTLVNGKPVVVFSTFEVRIGRPK